MLKRIVLEPHLTTGELSKSYRACTKPNEKVRWRALHLISSGVCAAEAARQVGRTSGWITQLTQRYNAKGRTAVADRRDEGRKVGRPATLQPELALELSMLHYICLRRTADCGRRAKSLCGLSRKQTADCTRQARGA